MWFISTRTYPYTLLYNDLISPVWSVINWSLISGSRSIIAHVNHRQYRVFTTSGPLIVHIGFVNNSFQWSGLGTNNTWVLDHVHIHWGSSDALGSEHTLDGVQYPFEVRMRSRLTNNIYKGVYCSSSIEFGVQKYLWTFNGAQMRKLNSPWILSVLSGACPSDGISLHWA